MLRPIDTLGPLIDQRLAFLGTSPAREATYAEPITPLPEILKEQLKTQGVTQLFSHQAQAWDAAQRGEDVAVVTGTSSGKTLCYNLPVIHALQSEPMARALYLFPTKALAQDQLGKFESLAGNLDLYAATFDGDTARGRRAAARKESHVILTNPDMLHVGILPNHESWMRFFRALRIIVIDEMHTYRGVFGSHVAGILRRLLRLCEWHRARPQIIACSATLANPGELFQDLTGRNATLITEDGAAHGERTIAILAPPIDEDPTSPALSPNVETGRILAELVTHNTRSLAFCRARTSAELVLRYARQALRDHNTPESWVESYRGGYTAAERRTIERDLFSGKLRGLATTNAMELGVDVGGLDAVIINGYPGTISSFWQQVGRAGRSGRPGFGLLITHPDPVEGFLARNPHLVLDRAVERASINLQNPSVLTAHLTCACHERAVSEEEAANFGASAIEVLHQLVNDSVVRESMGRFYYVAHRSPAAQINIRGTHGPQIQIKAGERDLGEMEEWRALRSLHEGAVYLHRGETFLVQTLDLDSGTAYLDRAEPDYYTLAMANSYVEPIAEIDRSSLGAWSATLNTLKITTMISGYRTISLEGGHFRDEFPLELPTREIGTLGVRIACDIPFEPDPSTVAAIHTAEHALIAVAPLFAGCDRNDLGSTWFAFALETAGPCLYVFDTTPGGVGLAESLMNSLTDWLIAARQLLQECPCEDGCPLCILSTRCECGNEPLDKALGLKLLSSWVPADPLVSSGLP